MHFEVCTWNNWTIRAREFKRRCSCALPLAGALAILAAQPSKAGAHAPHEYLSEAVAPSFYPQHTLPRLTRWGWSLSYETAVELADRWGYALEIAGYLNHAALDDIVNNPSGRNARLVALAQQHPERYPLSVLAYRPLVHNVAAMPSDLLDQYYLRDAAGNFVRDAATGGPSWRTVSPEAPPEIYRWASEEQAAPLAALRAMAPISTILSGGEYGLNVYGHSGVYWEQDPEVLSAKGSAAWYDYASSRKSRAEQLIANATRAAAPDRDLYVYYYADGAGDRGAYPHWWKWRFDYGQMRSVSDVATSSLYFTHANTGWTGSRDVLSMMLNSTALQLAYGDALSYNWVNAGHETQLDDQVRYMGFLKASYTAGMIGGVASYSSYPAGGFGADFEGPPPSWLNQIETLAQVHGAFSYLEKFLRNGDLLPGPNMHRWSTDLPAYEFPTGDPDARVLVRKLRDHDEWLVTAWAAEGASRLVTTDIPDLGQVELLARAEGSLYLMTRTADAVFQTLLDADGLRPSAALNMVSVTTDEGGVLDLPGDSILLDGDNFIVNFIAQPEYRLADVLIDGQSVGTFDSITLSAITDNHTVHFSVALILPPLAGDFDGDGTVASSDLLVWAANFGTAGQPEPISGGDDPTADVSRDGAGFLTWQRAFGQTYSTTAITVAEPRGALLAIAACCIAAAWKRRIA